MRRITCGVRLDLVEMSSGNGLDIFPEVASGPPGDRWVSIWVERDGRRVAQAGVIYSDEKGVWILLPVDDVVDMGHVTEVGSQFDLLVGVGDPRVVARATTQTCCIEEVG